MDFSHQKELSDFVSDLFRHYNKELFGSKLGKPNIQVLPTKRMGVRFHLDTPSEIRIGRDFQEQTKDDFTLQLLTSMVHLQSEKKGTPDTTANSYHTAAFANSAAKIGLFVKKHNSRGWAITSLSSLPGKMMEPDMTDYLRRNRAISQAPWDPDKFAFFQREMRGHSERNTTKKFLLKYVCKCPPPHNRIRSGRRPDGPNPLKVLCLECNEIFVHED